MTLLNLCIVSMVLSFIAQIIVGALTLVYAAIDIQLVTLSIQMLFPSLFS